MTPLTTDALQRFRQQFDGAVHLVRDYETFAIVFCVPRGCAVRDLLTFFEALPRDENGNVVMDPRGPHMVCIDPSASGPPPGLPQ